MTGRVNCHKFVIASHKRTPSFMETLLLSLLRCLPFWICAFPILFWQMTGPLILQRT